MLVRYADDFVILSRPGQGAELLARLKRWLEANGLTLNETKTRTLDVRREGFKFLGFPRFVKPNTIAHHSSRNCKHVLAIRLLGESEKRLVITSYDMENDDVRLIKTAHHVRLRNDYKLPMWQVGLATSAAPTFFSACKAIKNARLVDGGVWANNPTMVGLTEAVSLLEIPLHDIRILSIGTSWELKHRPDDLDDAGKSGWKKEIVDVIFRGQSHAAIKQAELLLNTPDTQRVLRVDFPVPEDTFGLDRVDLKRMLPKVEYYALHFGPKIEAMFFDHNAPVFEPAHTLTKEIFA